MKQHHGGNKNTQKIYSKELFYNKQYHLQDLMCPINKT